MALSYGAAAEIPMQGAVFNLGATMADAQKLQEGDITLQEERAMLPYKLQQAQQGSELSQDQYGNAQLAEIAMQANAAADPSQASTIWDQGMQRLAGEGITNASQYVGHYRKDLAQNVYDTFSGKGTANAGPPGPDPVVLYRTMAALPSDKLKQIVNNQNMVINGFNNVRDAAGLRNEIAVLQKSGIDVGPMLAGMDLNDDSPAGFARNYQAVTSMVNRLVPLRDTAAQILAEQTTGSPNVGPSYFSGGVGGKGRVPPGWKIQGYNAQGDTVFYNPMDPTQTMVGDTPVTNRPLAPRTPAAIQTFTYKFQFARDNLGMSDQDAADWANGRKTMQIPDEKRREFAERQSEQDLRDAQTAAFNSGNDADIAAVSGANEAKFKKADYDRIYNSLSNGPPAGGGQSGAAPPGTKPKYSPMQIKGIQQQARDAVKIKHKDRKAVIQTLQRAGVPVPPDL